MTTIASLIVNLGMNSAKFDSGAKKARGSLRSFAEGAIAVNAAMSIFQTVMSGVKGAIDEFAQSSARIDDLGKLSDRLGLSTESLGALQHGAELAGIETSQLNTALEKMTVNLA